MAWSSADVPTRCCRSSADRPACTGRAACHWFNAYVTAWRCADLGNSRDESRSNSSRIRPKIGTARLTQPARVVVQRSSPVFDFVESPDHLQNQRSFRRRRRPGHRRTSGRSMCPTGHFKNLAVGACVNPVIPTECVGLQVPRIVGQELRGPVPLAILGEIIDIVRERRGADVHPEPPPLMAPPFSPPQHRHWCIIGPDHWSGPHQFFSSS